MKVYHRLFRCSIKQYSLRRNEGYKAIIRSPISTSYCAVSIRKINSIPNKGDNIDLFGHCSCGRQIFQRWKSYHPVHILGNKICEECGSGCIEYINQQYGDIKLGRCCNQDCVSNNAAIADGACPFFNNIYSQTQNRNLSSCVTDAQDSMQ